MKKITINSNNRRFNVDSIVVGYLQENKVESILFEIPEQYKNFGKKACFSNGTITFSKLFDDISSNVLTFTKEITQFKNLWMTIEFFYLDNEEEIIARTSKLHIIIEDAVICDDDVSPDDPKVTILDELIEKVGVAIKEADNLNVEATRIDDGVNIAITDKKGNVKITKVNDGQRGEQGPQGEPGAIKMQIVDVLPTIGRSGTIYLVKKEVPSPDNSYDEYIYTGTAWEHIGDTSIDLSDYYTKEETDEALRGKQDPLVAGDNIKIEDDTISAEVNTFTINYYSLKTEDAETLIKIIDLVKAGKNFQLYAFLGSEKLLCTDVRNYTGNSPYFYFANPRPFNDTARYGINYTNYYYYVVNLDIKNKKATQTNDYNLVLNRNQVYNLPLGVRNTSAYIPTSDYNPSTKKYVDDKLTTLTGYDAEKTQILKNINGTLTWVDSE